MNIILKQLDRPPSAALTALVKQHLDKLAAARRIDEARVNIEHHSEASPPIHISVYLVTPGPDLFAEAVDHTVEAALLKVMGALTEAIDQRHLKQRANPQLKTDRSPLTGGRRGRARR